MATTFEAVLFDLDGTLVDSLPLIFRTYRRVFADLGLPWDPAAVAAQIGIPLKVISRKFAGARAGEFYRLYQSYYQEEHDRLTRLFPGTEEALSELRRHGLRLGIVTSKTAAVTRRTLALTGLGAFMEAVITVDDVKEPKPEPEPVLRGVAALGVEAGRALYVGDSCHDVLAGRRAGTTVAGVTWGLARREELLACGAHLVVDRWSELLAFVLDSGAP
ncbi:MAG: HAD-IA family hydrolase [Firmicutes bacterium]|nr:HAD-IA family hydrolase [Bacillota bacterium]